MNQAITRAPALCAGLFKGLLWEITMFLLVWKNWAEKGICLLWPRVLADSESDKREQGICGHLALDCGIQLAWRCCVLPNSHYLDFPVPSTTHLNEMLKVYSLHPPHQQHKGRRWRRPFPAITHPLRAARPPWWMGTTMSGCCWPGTHAGGPWRRHQCSRGSPVSAPAAALQTAAPSMPIPGPGAGQCHVLLLLLGTW